MPINNRELMNVVGTLAEQRNLRVCVVESFKGGLFAGASTIIGGLLFGPRGLAIGGIIGACSAAAMANNEFRSVADVLMNDLSNAQQQRLASSIREVISGLRVEDATVLLSILLSNQVAWRAVLKLVTDFIQREMHLQIIE